MTTPQSPVVPITAETQNSDIPFPCHMWSSSKAQLDSDGNGWVWVKEQDWHCDLRHTMFTHYCKSPKANPPDRMPGAVEITIAEAANTPEKAEKLVELFCLAPTASGDPCAKASAVRQHQTGSDAPKEPTRFHDGDPCVRAAKKCASILAPFNHYADKEAEAANEFEAIIRGEVAGHYEKEIDALRARLEQAEKQAQDHFDAYQGMYAEMKRKEEAYEICLKEWRDVSARLATAERERDEAREEVKDHERWFREMISDYRLQSDDHKVAWRLAINYYIHDLRARLSAAEADSKRLDWLEAITPEANVYIRKVIGQREESLYGWRTSRLRELIDAARQQHKEE